MSGEDGDRKDGGITADDEGTLEILDLSLNDEDEQDLEKRLCIVAALQVLDSMTMRLDQAHTIPKGVRKLIEPTITDIARSGTTQSIHGSFELTALPPIYGILQDQVFDHSDFNFFMACTGALCRYTGHPEKVQNLRADPEACKNIRILIIELRKKAAVFERDEAYPELEQFGLQEEFCQKILLLLQIILEALEFLLAENDQNLQYEPSPVAIENTEKLYELDSLGMTTQIRQFSTQYLVWLQTQGISALQSKVKKTGFTSLEFSMDDLLTLDDEDLELSFRQIIGHFCIDLLGRTGSPLEIHQDLLMALENLARLKGTTLHEIFVAFTGMPIIMEGNSFRGVTMEESTNFFRERPSTSELN